MSYGQAWAAVTSRRKAIPGDLGAAARAMQASHPGLDFEQAWDLVEAEALPFMRKGLTVGQALILARAQPVRTPGAPLTVKAIESKPKERVLLICGNVGTYVD